MFYTYLWLREDGTPYYVGKGTRSRAYINHRIKRPTRDKILVQEFLCEEDAFFAEKFLISYYGRSNIGAGCLRNLTDGGEGTSGAVRKPLTEDVKRKISEALTGIPTGRKPSSEQLRKAALGRVGNKNCLGRNMSAATRTALRKANFGRKLSEETKAKMRAAHLGIRHTEETKLKMSKLATEKGFVHRL